MYVWQDMFSGAVATSSLSRSFRLKVILPASTKPITYYQHYICPGCGTFLQVDVWCPLIDTDEPIWDIDVKV
jgi:hypothetical protein